MANKLKTMSVSCGRIRGLIRNKTVSLYVDTPQGHRSVCVEHVELADLYQVISTLHDSLGDPSKKEVLKKAAPQDRKVELDDDDGISTVDEDDLASGLEEISTP